MNKICIFMLMFLAACALVTEGVVEVDGTTTLSEGSTSSAETIAASSTTVQTSSEDEGSSGSSIEESSTDAGSSGEASTTSVETTSAETSSESGEEYGEPMHCDDCDPWDVEYDQVRDACVCANNCESACGGPEICIDDQICAIPCEVADDCPGEMTCGLSPTTGEFVCMYHMDWIPPPPYDENHCDACAESDKFYDASWPGCACLPECTVDEDCTWPATCADVDGPTSRCVISCDELECPADTFPPLVCAAYEADVQVCIWHNEGP